MFNDNQDESDVMKSLTNEDQKKIVRHVEILIKKGYMQEYRKLTAIKKLGELKLEELDKGRIDKRG